MKKFIVSTVVVLTFVTYAFRAQLRTLFTEQGGDDLPKNINVGGVNNTNDAVVNGNQNSTNENNANTSTVAGQWRDGSYTGSVGDAFYGPVQVQAIISNGRLTNVNFLQYPNDRQHSIEVSQYSLPILRSEAIQAQSSTVDIVSGATDTSMAFMQSLASAFGQAK